MKKMIVILVIAAGLLFAEELPFELVVQRGHNGSVSYMEFTADSRIICSGSSDDTIKTWDALTCREMRTFTGQGPIACSPDNSMIAGIALKNTSMVLIWSFQNGECLYRIELPGEITAQTFSPDSKSFAVGVKEKGVYIVNLENPEPKAVLEHAEQITALTYYPDGSGVFAGGEAGSLYLIPLDGNEPRVTKLHENAVTDIAAHWNGELAIGRAGGVITLAANDEITNLTGLGAKVTDVDFNGNASELAIATVTHGMILRVKDQEMMQKYYTGYSEGAISPNWSRLATSQGFIWNLRKGERIRNIQAYASEVDALAFSNNQTLITSGDSVYYKDYEYRNNRLKVIRTWDLAHVGVSASASHDFDGILAGFDEIMQYQLMYDPIESTAWVLDRLNGKQAAAFNLPKVKGYLSIYNMQFFNNNKRILLGCDERFLVADLEKNTVVYDLTQEETYGYTSVGVSHDSSRGAGIHYAGECLVFNLHTGELLCSFKGAYPFARQRVPFSPDNQKIAYLMDAEKGIAICNINTRTVEKEILLKEYLVSNFIASPDWSFFVAALYPIEEKGTAGILAEIDPVSGTIIKTYTDLTSEIKAMTLSPDSNLIAAGGDDGITWVVNRTTEGVTGLFNTVDEWVYFSKDGYFEGSLHGGRLLSLMQGARLSPIDQLAIHANRPDIILEKLGTGDKATIEYMQSLYAKRLKRMGMKAEEARHMALPLAALDGLKPEEKKAEVAYQFESTGEPLGWYNIFVNDVPVYKGLGKAVPKEEEFLYIGSEVIELNSGQNKIEVSCRDRNGIESLRSLSYAEYKADAPGKLYYIGLGVSDYADDSLDLQFAHKDAADLADVFKKHAEGAFTGFESFVRVNEDVSADAIARAGDFLKNAAVDDTVILFIAGHGMYSSGENPEYHYLPHGADLKAIADTCIPFEQIEGILEGIAPRRKMFLLDTCESGELDDVQIARVTAPALEDKGVRARSIARERGIKKVKKKERPQKRIWLLDRNRYIFADLKRRTGSIVFSSCRGDEVSYEFDTVENGAFTHTIKNAFTDTKADQNKDGKLSTDEFRKYVMDQVPVLCREMGVPARDVQHPVVDRDNIYQKFAFSIENGNEEQTEPHETQIEE